jgi:anti-anti-sigma factor
MLKKRIEDRGSVVVLSLAGQLDALTSDDMCRVAEGLLAKGARKVVCDLDELSLLDCVGISTIISLLKSMRSHNGEVTVANLKHQPRAVFNVLHMNKLIKIFDSVDKAIETLHQTPLHQVH